MPSIIAEIEFLADLPLYQEEKPFMYLPGEHEDLDPDRDRLSNLEFENYKNIHIEDARDHPELSLNECGFEYISHDFDIHHFDGPGDIDEYRAQTEQILQERFNAVKVLTYEVRQRRNEHFQRKKFDFFDKMLVEGPAKGAHNDVTYDSGPILICRYLPEEDQKLYLRPGYRFRIVNTWRPLLEVLEDRPLALCDSRSVAPEDLLPADRILPDRVGEVYYLKHNQNHKWYWLEKQKQSELYIFLMYDTMSTPNSARFCPHVSFVNSRASVDAPPRASVETRSIVITKDSQ